MEYANIDKDLIQTHQLQGASYHLDNKHIYKVIKQATLTGLLWEYIQFSDCHQDMCAAFKALYDQAYIKV